jgi:pyrroline-5-carboxylate reductase
VKKPIVFLGGGRIASALVEGLRRAGENGTLIVHDLHRAKLQELRRKFGVVAQEDLQRAVAQAGLLVIAVRPLAVKGLLQELAGLQLRRGTAAVSLAAGVPLKKLRGWLPGTSWARAMPSPVCRSARGLTALTFAPGLPVAARKKVRQVFSRVGAVVEIPETQFNAFTVVYSSSHGYHALAALAAAGRKLGMGREAALSAAAHALEGAICFWREEGQSLEELLRHAATPGGIAEATMAAMNAAGYLRAVERGVREGMRRARGLAAKS